MEIYNLLSSVAVRIPQLVTVQLAESMKQNLFISETLNEMRNNSLLCDTRIVGNDGQTLHAHACILAAVSPILRSLLTQNSGTNIHISTDSIASDMWERVLRLIYCGDVQVQVCDLITFLDITHELDIRGLHVVYEPVEPTRRSCNLRLVAQNDDDTLRETPMAATRKCETIPSTESSECSEDKDIIFAEERVGFDIVGSGSKQDVHVDSRNHTEALLSFEGSDYIDDVTEFSDLAGDKDSDLLTTSASPSLVLNSIAMDVKSELGADIRSRDTTAKFTPARSRNTSSPHGLLTCKTEPCDSQASLSRWCGSDSAMSGMPVSQESDVLAEAFVSSGLLPLADIFSRHQYVSSEYDSHLGVESSKYHHMTPTDPVLIARSRRREKRFACDICRRTFGQMSDLHRHHRVHTGERPYSCDICGVRFTQSASLKRHARLLHGHALNRYVMPHGDTPGVKS